MTYITPPLTVDVVLNQQVSAPPILDVVLCQPVDNSVSLTIDVIVGVSASAELSITEFVVGVGIDAVLPINPQAEIVATYDVNVFRGAKLGVSSDLQYSKLQGIDKSGSFEGGQLASIKSAELIDSAKLLSVDSQARFEANIKLTTGEQALTEQSKLVGTDSEQLYESQNFVDTKSQLKNETAKRVSHSNWYSYEAMLARQTQRKVQGEYSYLDAIMRHTSSDYGKLAGYRYRNLIETAKLPSWFTSYIAPPLWQTVILRQQLAAPTLPLDVTLCVPKSQSPRSKLSIAQSDIDVYGYLVLTAKESDGTEPTPSKGVIFVTNSVSLTRSDDGREIKLLGFSVGIDSNSYCWTFSATVPLSELSKVDTAREQQIGVDFTCNGNLWRFILDSCEDSIQFGESSLTIKGKSRAMLLASPYSSQRGFKFDTAMSARQIAEAELNRNGVPSGFTLDWQLAGVNGWNVPANTYSYSNKTPINSLQWIAEAAGGFINADMSADVLHVLARYPIPSWEWAAQTPSINLTQSLITSRSRGRVNKPAYNGVTIYGENDGGIGALIKRTGTSGGYQPPMVTSDLMTDQDAAISRGKMILSDTGDIGNIGISMPLIADIGVLKPSTLIGVNDGEQWVGMVRGTTITGRLSSNRALEIDQSIDVERHFDKEVV
ncbi:hypothetical protein ACOBWA_08385 [Psychrobacter sp. ER1]|uniref:hypothetical protein n=1 Tax=Psychrobacter sp. ER1 TaxID=3406645 RepID=UPI003B434A99